MLHPKLSTLDLAKRSDLYDKHPERRADWEQFPLDPVPDRYRQSLQTHSQLTSLRQRLDRVSEALAKDTIAWQSERETYESVVRALGSI